MRGTRLALLCLLPLAACGHRAVAPAATSAVPPTDVSSPDGGWRGSSTRFQADGRGCPGPGLINTVVLDRQFQRRWGARANIAAVIAADGTVSGQAGDVTLIGKFTGSAITADATSPNCGLHYTLRRSA